MVNENDTESLNAIRDGILPEEIKASIDKFPGGKDFLSDFADFLIETGEKGRDLALKVFDNEKISREVCQREDMPKPIRFLAMMILKNTA